VSVVRCRTLTPTEKTTYEVLLSYADAHGMAHPGQARLAAEVGVSAPTVRAALRALAAAGLITPRRRGQGLTNAYHVLRVPLRGPTAERKGRAFQNERPRRSKAQIAYAESDRTEQESGKLDQPPSPLVEEQIMAGGEILPEWAERVAADATLIYQAVGMDPADAAQVAQDAAAQHQPPDYIAELVAHVTSAPGVHNPAGCLRALVRQGKRRPPRGQGGVPPRHARPALCPDHYRPGGKYAHLFHAASVRREAGPVPPEPAPHPPVAHAPALPPRGPSAFAIQADPLLAGRGRAAWPRGQPSTRP
jgi:DNA-binding transcriptional ArsR family regulator